MGRLLTVPVGAVVVCLGLAGCTGRSGPTFLTPTSASPTTTTTTPLKSVGLIPAPAFVTDRVVLSKHKVRAGTAIAGTLVVTNRSSNPINLTKQCEPDYVIVIRNRAINQEPAFTTSCVSQPLILHPGVNRFPISVTTTYFACLQPGGESTSPMPKCMTNGPPPLPPGNYSTVLYGSGDLALPEPVPVRVKLTK